MIWTSRVANIVSRTYSEITKIVVGPERVGFVITKSLLQPIAVFRDALLNDEVFVSETRPKVFSMFVTWLYCHCDLNISMSSCPKDWVELHLYAVELGLPQLQDATMDVLQDLYLERDWIVVSPDIWELVSTNNGLKSVGGLRKWCVAMTISALLKHQCKASELAPIFLRGGFAEDFLSYLQHSIRYSPGVSLLDEDPRQREPISNLDSDFMRLPSGFPRCFFHSHWILECSDCSNN